MSRRQQTAASVLVLCGFAWAGSLGCGTSSQAHAPVRHNKTVEQPLVPAFSPAVERAEVSTAPAPIVIDDASIAHRLRADLTARPHLSPWLITSRVRRGVAILTGSVNTLADSEDAVHIAKSTPGVRAVIDRLELIEPEVGSAQIAERVESALSAEPALSNAALRATGAPSGQVELVGTVSSPEQREIAVRVAKEVPGARSVRVAGVTVDHSNPRTDEQIQLEAQRRISILPGLDPGAVQATASDNVVHLSGDVQSSTLRYQAYLAAWVRGVKDVNAEGLRVVADAAAPLSPPSRAAEVSDDALRESVEITYRYDPRMFGAPPRVSVFERVVTLRGAVPSVMARRVAEQHARNTVGVRDVDNRLTVVPRRAFRDNELRERVTRAFDRCPHLDGSALGVQVQGGRVTVYGTLRSEDELEHAEQVARRVSGLPRVQTHVVVAGGRDTLRSDEAMRRAIERRLWSDNRVDAEQVQVTVSRGTVTLLGAVNDAGARSAALEIARSLWPDRVVDMLSVRQSQDESHRISRQNVQ